MSTSMTSSVQKLEYRELNEEIKRTMHRSARDVVRLGFMLRQMMEKRMWEVSYGCFDEYLAGELHLNYTMATRFMNINRKYSVSGNSMEIAQKYEGYSQGLLIEMLNMPQELEEKVSPDMTIKQVREMKKQAKAEQETPEPLKAEKQETVIDGECREIREPEEDVQPEFPVLKNNDHRKEWLNNYKAWGLWYRDENIDVNYYKYDFSDGSRLIVAEYPKRHSYWTSEYQDEHYYHLLEKNKKGYKKPYDEQYRQKTDSETYLVEFLKRKR